MLRALLASVLLVPALAFADVDPAFAKLRDAALRPEEGGAIEGLGPFLERFVGECNSLLGSSSECQDSAKSFRLKTKGKMFYLILNEEQVSQLAAGPFNPRDGEHTLNITPFFPANGYALTQGAPRKTDSDGNPLLPLIQIPVPIESTWNANTLPRYISMKAFKIQIVFTPEEVWSLPKPGEKKKIYGVKARIHGILVEGARSGKELALWVENKK